MIAYLMLDALIAHVIVENKIKCIFYSACNMPECISAQMIPFKRLIEYFASDANINMHTSIDVADGYYESS